MNQCLESWNHMEILVIPFFIFLLIFAVYPAFSSPAPTCGNNTFYIQYPFHLLQEGQNPHANSKPFILKCDTQLGDAVLNLPFSGEFNVRDIDYFEQKILLYDPGNCLPGRLMKLSLLNSPFVAILYQNYTFFSCPPELMESHNLTAINCLSNPTISILASSSISRTEVIKKLKGCNMIVNLQIPVSSIDQFEFNGFDGDLQLAWRVPSCNGDCKAAKKQRNSVVNIFIICLVALSISILSALFCIGCCLVYKEMIILETIEANDQTSHGLFTNRGREIAQISRRSLQSCMEAEGRQCISLPNTDVCPICYEEYHSSSESPGLTCQFNHRFHAHCLERWLENKKTCPVCRSNIVS